MKHKLMSMLEFIQWVESCPGYEFNNYMESVNIKTSPGTLKKCWLLTRDHAEFLSQKPQLLHFLRVGLSGNILQEPEAYKSWLELKSRQNEPEVASVLQIDNEASNGNCQTWDQSGNDIIFQKVDLVHEFKESRTVNRVREYGINGVILFNVVGENDFIMESYFDTIEDVIKAITPKPD